MKTEDGGESWSEPIHCQLGGENGLEEVKEFIPDSVLPGSVSNRDSLFFSMEYHLDMVVDFEGNAHITGLIALADSLQQWYPSYQLMGTFHVIFNNESESWDARHLYSNHTFEGVFDSQFSQYNNPHISSDVDGQFLFLSWIDSDVEGLENNIMPNFYSITYATEDDAYSEINNLTEFTQAMWHAYFAGQSHYVFRDTLPGVGVVFNIPVVYQELSDDLDPLEPVQYWYIEGFKFIIPDISVEENQTATFKLTNAYPNPFSEKVKIKLNVSDSENLEIEVFNSTGQLVKSIPIGRLPKGKHQIEINTSGLTRDVYFLRLKSGKKCEGLKMIKL
ncbi:MAG: T9SS type A sorting domain-containing protein [Bacteroidota bacterium]|nr:T9SS type A sorting domain-containing protein [Bacteroidota bacterium]